MDGSVYGNTTELYILHTDQSAVLNIIITVFFSYFLLFRPDKDMAGLSCEYISPVGESKVYYYHNGVGYLDSRDQRCDNYRQSFHDHCDDNGMESAWSNHVSDSPWRDSPSCQDSSCELHALANPTYDSDHVTGSAWWTDSSWNDGLLEENEELHFQVKYLEKQLESLKEKNRAQKDELSRMKV